MGRITHEPNFFQCQAFYFFMTLILFVQLAVTVHLGNIRFCSGLLSLGIAEGKIFNFKVYLKEKLRD